MVSRDVDDSAYPEAENLDVGHPLDNLSLARILFLNPSGMHVKLKHDVYIRNARSYG